MNVSDDDRDGVEDDDCRDGGWVDGTDDASEEQGQVRQWKEDSSPERDRPHRGQRVGCRRRYGELTRRDRVASVGRQWADTGQ